MQKSKEKNTEKIIIIGGGPAGLASAVYLARADLKPLVIEGSAPGGQLMTTSDVENFPGFESILGPDLMVVLKKQAGKFGTRYSSENIIKVEKKGEIFQLDSRSSEGELYTQSLLIATGASALWLGLENETRLRGKGVSACATCDGFFFRDKTVVVVGGGDTAMEEALTLTKFAKKVYIVHRRAEFRASKIMQERVLKNKKIKPLWESKIVDVLGKDRVEGVLIENLKSGKSESLKTDGLFIAIGHKPETAFLKDSGVVLDEKGYVITSQRYAIERIKLKTQNSKPKTVTKNLKSFIANGVFDFNYQYATSVAGIFAAGDVCDPYYRQAGTASGMGIAAALEIERYLQNL